MIVESGNASRQLLWGNFLLAGCCVFYLLWWFLANKTTNPIKGFKSGWLLLPALFLGIAAVVLLIRGSQAAPAAPRFFSGGTVLLVAILSYVALLLLSRLAFHRRVTTELFLIVGWAALACLETNALCGLGVVPHGAALVFFAVAVLIAAASLVCYLLYYQLHARAALIDGMIPLLLGSAYMLLLNLFLTRA